MHIYMYMYTYITIPVDMVTHEFYETFSVVIAAYGVVRKIGICASLSIARQHIGNVYTLLTHDSNQLS